MAEVVELRVEDTMMELEQLQRLKIFNDAEIRNIVKQRKKHQYKVQRRAKSVEDFVRYIMYEMDLYKLIKSRKIKLGITGKKNEVENIAANRINNLFEQAISKFPQDIHLWLSYMKFCRQLKIFNVCVSNLLVSMLAVHSNKVTLWRLAATWEYEENHSIQNACQYLMRGLRHHPNSKTLYTEAFRMHLVYAEKKRMQVLGIGQGMEPGSPNSPNEISFQGDEAGGGIEIGARSSSQDMANDESLENNAAVDAFDPSTDPIINLTVLEFIYDTAFEKVGSSQFLINLLNIAKDFSFTQQMQNKIVKDMIDKFGLEEQVWDCLARRELEGYHLADRPPVPEEGDDQDLFTSLRTDEEKIQYMRVRRAFTVYQRGIMVTNSRKMWSLYLDFLTTLNHESPTLKKIKRSLIIAALQRAHSSGYLEEKHYIYWSGLFANKKKDLVSILTKATAKCPRSVELWQMRMRLHLSQGEEKLAANLFKMARSSVGNDNIATLPLWKMMIQYYQTKSINKVKEMFKEGIEQGPNVATPLKEMYLEWLVMGKNITAARQVYQQLSEKTPSCFELHKKMAVLECLQPQVDISKVIKCYELACQQCGKDPEVWMEYINFLMKKNETKKVKEIYLRALKSLDEQQAHIFIAEFCENNALLGISL